LPLAPEGWPFVLAFALLGVLTAGLVRPWLSVFPFLLMAFMVFFFRDPERTVPPGPDTAVSAADGRVISVKKIMEDEYLHREMTRVSVFMSPMNVHVNRAPLAGRVEKVVHTPGRFMAAYRDEASMENEHLDMILTGEAGPILVRQVAGFLARRAVCRVGPGDSLSKGERYGVIKFGSRLDVYLPPDTEILVHKDQRVYAGETVLGRLPGAGSASEGSL